MARLFPVRSRRVRKAPGTPPGTITIDPDAPPPQLRVIAYGPDEILERQVDDPDELPALLEAWPVVWINVDGLGDEATLRRLQEMFGLHRLAMEDVTNVVQRPKVEPYDGPLFMVTRMAYLPGHLESEQLSLFLADNWVLTFQVRPGDCLEPVRQRLRKHMGRIRTAGADYLAYALLDAVVDNFFPLLETYGERLQAIEDRVIAHPAPEAVGEIHQVKRDLLHLRRAIWPHREMVGSLLRDEHPQISADTRVYLRDVYDHVAQLIDMLEIYREIASGLLDAYLSSLSNRMNEVMKVLTMIATIFIPLSFLAGVYGMNFEYMPETQWRPGYFVVLGLMTLVGGGMLLAFWRKGWLGGDDRETPPPSESRRNWD